MTMKYKVGDRVRIKSLDWYNMHCDDAGNVDCGCEIFEKDMKPYLGKVFTIHRIVDNSKYEMEEAFDFFLFTDEMIEGLVEEETLIERFDDNGLPFNEWLSHKGAFHIPDGYKLKDENGNVINATRIVLEKKKKEYPKTYEECVEILGRNADVTYGYKKYVLHTLQMLLVCRDAYWQIAGDEMGLDEPWEPDWDTNENELFVIANYNGTIVKTGWYYVYTKIIAFPTEEMRDIFYENFKELIEQCKELL